MKTEYYKKVFIESESDLPKEDGRYLAESKYSGLGYFDWLTNNIHKGQWLSIINYYFLPVESTLSQGNKDLIIEKQGELIKRKCKHSPDCYLNQNWQEAIDAFNDTPMKFRDADWHEALEDVYIKMRTCSCGLEQLKSELSALQSVTPDKAEGDTLRDELIRFLNTINMNDTSGELVDEYLNSRVTMHDLQNDDSAREESK